MPSIDTDLRERMLGPVAMTKTYLFVGSDNGGKTAADLYSIMASVMAEQVEPFAYVRDLLRQLPSCSSRKNAVLLPGVWLSAHPESHRCWSRLRGDRILRHREANYDE